MKDRPTCHDCRHCGPQLPDDEIRCDHPDWDDEDTDQREITPQFGEMCGDFEAKEKPAVPACPVCFDNLVIDRPNYPDPPRYGNCPRCNADGRRTTRVEEPDPLPALISDLLAFEGMAPETRVLIELAVKAQKTGAMPDLSAITEGGAR